MLAGGAQQFVVSYNIQDGCHACAILGHAFYSFEFGADGAFNGAVFTAFIPGGGASTPSVPVRLAAHQRFTISLPANRSAGYSWKIDSAPEAAILKSFGSAYHEGNTGRTGAAGEELWTFETAARGETTFALKYVRSWSRNGDGKTIALTVIVE
jgi:predicted secreted protein